MNENIKEVAHHRIAAAAKAFELLLRGHSITTRTRRGGRGEGRGSRKSTLAQVTKGRYHLKCSQLSTQVGRG